MILTDDDDTSIVQTTVEIDLSEEYKPIVHELRLLQTLLSQVGVEISLARMFAGAASLGIDVYMSEHFGSRGKSLKKKFLDKLRENPRYGEST